MHMKKNDKLDVASEIHDVQQMALGDVTAFNRLYARYHKPVHANIIKLIKTRELAAEVLQDVFLALWQNRYKISPEISVGSWLFVVSYNKSLNVLRKKVQESVAYLADYPQEIAADEEDVLSKEDVFQVQLQLLDEAVDVLPARKREVFRMCRYEGRTKEDVATQLGISPQTVSDYLKQSNKAIRAYLIDRYPAYVGKAMLFLFFCS